MSRNRIPLLVLLTSTVALQACGGSRKPSGPEVTSLAPATGTSSTVVAISGAGFTGTTASPPTVTFTPSAGGASYPAQVASATATGVDVAVPAVPAALAAAGTAFDVTIENPGGGSTTLPHAFTMAAPTLADVNGGLAGSGSQNSLFIVDGAAFGDLSAQAAGYSVDFRDAGSGAVVASAAVGYAAGDWTNIYVVGTVPASLSTGTTYQVTVTTPSGTSAPRTFEVLGGVPFSPSQIQWSATSSLPVAQQGFSAAVAAIGTTSYVYAIGGNVATAATADGKASNVSTVYVNPIDAATGALAGATWTTATPLPDQRGFAAAVVADAANSLVPGNGNLYVLGGLDGTGAATSTVYFASLASDGTIPAAGAPGTWAETTPLPQALFATSAVLFHGRIYVAGGNDSTGAPVAKVWAAKIQADGTLAAWEPQPDLPAALAYHQLVTSAGYLYALGGDTAAVDPVTNALAATSQSAIYYDQIDIRNGALVSAAWTTNASSLGKAREKFTAVVAGSYVLVSGGLYNGASTGSSEQSYAQLGSQGAIGSFNGATGSHTIAGSASGYDFYNHAAAFFVDGAGAPHVLVLGGADVGAGTVHDGVWYQH
ncbi:Kelch repeat-containing protein [Anaeromyxobacter oryzae]|uniref:IPT/TIG domain-containing protein n=1 Tax=Anaeromyxobacter oryzae TaxID=2918170 RepID=A0ABM7WPH4_9BACT|nr:hypothetical protein [Anaeromyxobacter oryzae]BDG01358.1 hypothetical protein AMOR_03540 [Anaeromyxobacter oryzae]